MEDLGENNRILLDWRYVSVVSTADVLFEETQNSVEKAKLKNYHIFLIFSCIISSKRKRINIQSRDKILNLEIKYYLLLIRCKSLC